VHAGTPVELSLDGEAIILEPLDILIEQVTRGLMATAQDGALIVALDLEITEDLKLEGLARDLVRFIQNARKEMGLEMSDRIHITYQTEKLGEVFTRFKDYICGETLALKLEAGVVADGLLVELPEGSVRLAIQKA